MNEAPLRRPRGGRLRKRLPFIAATLVLIVLVVRWFAGLYTERLWFSSVSAGDVWMKQTMVRLALSVGAFVLSVLLIWVNLRIADRAAFGLPRASANTSWRSSGYSFGLSGRLEAGPRLVASLALGAIVAPVIGSRWQELLMFLYGGSVSVDHPGVLGARPGFYMFTVPFLVALIGWFITVIVICAGASVIVYSMSGSIRRLDQRVLMGQGANTHLSMLFALFCIAVAFSMWLGRFGLAVGERGDFVGLLYTDSNVRVPAFGLLSLTAAVVAGAAISNVRIRNWTIPTVAGCCWVVVAIITLGIAPAIVESWSVNPNRPDKEQGYLDRHIASTFFAYGLDDFTVTPPVSSTGVPTIKSAERAAASVRLWDPSPRVMLSQVRSSQQSVKYYRFGDIDLDRYEIDGQPTLMSVGAREIDPSSENGWVNQVLKYTHGYGVVIANAVTTDGGSPQYAVKGFDFEASDPRLTNPRLYFGQEVDGYSIAGTKSEFIRDDEPAAEPVSTGIQLSGSFRRLMFSLRLADLNIVRSRSLGPSARLVMRRNVVDRARTVAPFLRFDSDPYPVVVEGRVLWVLDAYTTSDRFPGAQRHELGSGDLSEGSELASGFNYVRNSVRVVIDGHDGTMQLYRTDATDPIAKIWSKAFPSLFRSGAQLELDHPGLGSHLRYPSDLLSIQSSIYGNYHHDSPAALLSGEQRWEPSPNLKSEIGDRPTATNPVVPTRTTRAAPVYRFVELPGESTSSFRLTQTLESAARDSGFLTAMFSGETTTDGRNRLRVTAFGKGLLGVTKVNESISTDTAVSTLQTQLGQKNSEVLLGSMQVVVVGGDQLVYVRPMYTLAEGSSSAPARLVYVVAFDGTKVSIARTAKEALLSLVDPGEPTFVNPTSDPRTVIADTARRRAAAEARLKETGDVVEYQRSIDAILDDLEAADRTLSTTVPIATSRSRD